MEELNVMNILIGHLEMMEDLVSDGELPVPYQESEWYRGMLKDCYDMDDSYSKKVYTMIHTLIPVYCKKNNIPLGSITDHGNGRIRISVDGLSIPIETEEPHSDTLITQALQSITSLYGRVYWYYT